MDWYWNSLRVDLWHLLDFIYADVGLSMKPAGKKEKGRRLELKVSALIRRKGLDKDAKRMILSGADWAFRGDILTRLPFTFECKNNEAHRIWEEWEQARGQAKPMKPPVLVISGNNRPILAVMEMDDFLNLLLEVKQNANLKTT